MSKLIRRRSRLIRRWFKGEPPISGRLAFLGVAFLIGLIAA